MENLLVGQISASVNGSHAVLLRNAQIEDEPLLFALFAEEKARQWFGAALDPMQLRPLLEMQYRVRCSGYQNTFPRAKQLLIVDHDAGPIGQVLLHEGSDAIRVVDFCIASAFRGHGIGGAVLRGIQDNAAQRGKGIQLQVAIGAAAKSLYLRHGFETTGGDEVMEQMRWSGRAAERKTSRPITDPG